MKKKVPRESWVALIFLWLIFAMNANGRNIISVLLTCISDKYSLSPDVAGYVMIAAQAAAFVIMLLFTRETNGKRKGKDISLIKVEKCNIDMSEEA